MLPMPERTLSSRHAFRGRLLTLRVDEVELESGRRAVREVVEHPGAVAILAIDAGTIRDAKSLVGILWLARRGVTEP